MNRLRLWILGLSLGSFAAGMVIGHVVPEFFADASASDGKDQDYLRDMVSNFGLTSAQERSLRLVLQKERESEFEILSTAEWEQLPPPILNKLRLLRSNTQKRILMVLDERQRVQFEQQSRWPASGARQPKQN